jgi:hypothetical protein
MQAPERARDQHTLMRFALGACVAIVLTLLQGPDAGTEELAMGWFAIEGMPSQAIGLDLDATAEDPRRTAFDEPASPCLTGFLRLTSDRVGRGYPQGAWVGMAVLDLAQVLGSRTCTFRTGG